MALLEIGVLDATTSALIEGAKVTVDRPLPHPQQQAVTDKNGECSIWTSDGKNRVVVEHDDYNSKSVIVDVKVGVSSVPVTIDLTPKTKKTSKAKQAFGKGAKNAWQNKLFGGVKPSATGIGGWFGENIFSIGIGVIFALVGYFWIPGFKDLPGIWTWLLPLVVLFITAFTAHGKGFWRTLIYAVIILIITSIFTGFIDAITTGKIYNIDYWLNKLNFLHLLGVPEGTLESFKDGIRSVLCTLTNCKKLPVTPVAEKIGGYQALEVKFGSKYANYVPPALYAPSDNASIDDYSIPITVINPNPSDSGLIIKNFKISNDIYMKNKTGFRLMCGQVDNCGISNPNKCEIEPGRDEQISVDFKEGSISGCSLGSVYEVKDNIYDKESCDRLGCRFTKSSDCVCEVKRTANDFTDLCKDFAGSKVTIELNTHFDFDVVGTTEFRLVQKDDDVQLMPSPKITSSSGPLTVTAYFSPDYFSNGKPRSVKMFVSISNTGGGSASISNAAIDVQSSQIVFNNKTGCEGKIRNISVVNDGKDNSKYTTCDFITSDGKKQIGFSGPYATIPVSIRINYTYDKTESTTIPIVKNDDFCPTVQ